MAKKLASLATSPPSLPLLATSSPTLPPATVEQLEVWKMLQEEERRVQEEEMMLREQELQEQHLLWQQQRMQELQDTWKGQISTPAETDLKTNMDTNMVEEVFMAEHGFDKKLFTPTPSMFFGLKRARFSRPLFKTVIAQKPFFKPSNAESNAGI